MKTPRFWLPALAALLAFTCLIGCRELTHIERSAAPLSAQLDAINQTLKAQSTQIPTLLTLFALVVALAEYLATVRRRYIDKLGEHTQQIRKLAFELRQKYAANTSSITDEIQCLVHACVLHRSAKCKLKKYLVGIAVMDILLMLAGFTFLCYLTVRILLTIHPVWIAVVALFFITLLLMMVSHLNQDVYGLTGKTMGTWLLIVLMYLCACLNKCLSANCEYATAENIKKANKYMKNLDHDKTFQEILTKVYP